MYKEYCKNKIITGLEIAVIGIGCRFPQANNYHQLWKNLLDGKELVSRFTEEELLATGVSKEVLSDPSFVRVKAAIEESDQFDASFFNYNAKEAEQIEPQERLLYESVWEALEDAGCIPELYSGKIGLYAGAFFNLYWPLQNILKNGDKARLDLNQFDDKDFICSRISYKLNLTGPSVALQTACSTSLVAIHLACRALLTGECQMAVAGGASVKLPVKFGHIYQEGGVYSRKGHLRAFDVDADGIVEGDGVGAVVLKRLEDALNEGDNIYAIIKGSAINNDGNSKVGYYSPSVNGQLDVLQQCYQTAEIVPQSLRFIECHGTGTPLGDQIEVESLRQAFNTNERHLCALGSSKNNFGHTAAAAGILSFIKAVLSIKNKIFPPHINFTTPHPKLELHKSPFYISAAPISLMNDSFPLRGGISSFGIGGTNAHVVLEEMGDYPAVANAQAPQLFVFSARSAKALTTTIQNMSSHLSRNERMTLEDMTYTLQIGRRAYEYRAALVADSKEEALKELSHPQTPALISKQCAQMPPQVVFMFPGQGAHYVHMGTDLYQKEPVFCQAFEACRKILQDLAGIDIYQSLYSPQTNTSSIHAIDVSPMITFSFEYALAQLLQDMGIQPAALIGHSIGEYVAACLSGVFSLRDALQLVVCRGRLMKQIPEGMMFSVPMTMVDLVKLMPPHLDVAADHGASCIISGPTFAATEFQRQLQKNKVITQVLNIEKAGHSAMMDSILADYLSSFKTIALNKPQIPFLSNVTGTWIDERSATDPNYWVKQLRSTVQFDKGLDTILELGQVILLEVGPGNSLSMLAHSKTSDKSKREIIYTVKPQQQKGCDIKFLTKQLAKYWVAGGKLNWKAFHRDANRKKVSLPTYPFERASYSQDVSFIFDSNKAGQLSANTRKPIYHWFYQPAWQLKEIPQKGSKEQDDCYLIFIDQHGTLEHLVNDLLRKSRAVYQVKYGTQFQVEGSLLTINPQIESHYQQLAKHLADLPHKVTKIIHGWSLSNKEDCLPNRDWISTIKLLGFYSLVEFVNAYTEIETDGQIRILVFTNGLSDVQGNKPCYPEKSLVHGAVKVIPKEHSNLSCQTIDFPCIRAEELNGSEVSLVALQELASKDDHQVICYYRGLRYVQDFVPLVFPKKTQPALRLRKHGTYVITGGLGGIGLTLAEHVANQSNGNIVLFSRTPFPEPSGWEDYLLQHPQSTISQKIKCLQRIQEKAHALQILQADVSSPHQMQKLFDKVRRELGSGSIHGVIHCAGAFDGNMLFENTQEKSEKIFASKVEGTLILDQLIQEDTDFFVVCSSLSSHLAGIGQLNYCAASIFLDYYAKFKTANSRIFTLSINWDAWKEVGGAVQTIADLYQKSQSPQSQNETKIRHPLVSSCLSQTSAQTVFEGKIDPSCWVVADHQVMGKPTMPGVGFVELVVAAFKAYIPCKDLDLSEVYLLKPLEVVESQEIRVIFDKAEQEYNFKIISSTPHTDFWEENVRGSIKAVADKNGQNISIDSLKAACSVDCTLNFIKRLKEDNTTKFGEQWQTCIKSYWLGKNEALIELQLADKFLAILQDYKLHPALFDHSMSILAEGKAYVPFMYGKVHVFNDLTPHLFAKITAKNPQQIDDKMISYQVNIVDAAGNLLIEIDDYTLLRVDNFIMQTNPVSERSERKPFASFVPHHDPTTTPSEFAASLLTDAITCEEGKEVFSRLMGSDYPNLVVSTNDFHKRLEENKQDSFLADQPASENKVRGVRPTMTVQYAEPKSQHEVKLAKVWQDLLSIDKVGIYDNFFDLGANSLQIIQAAGKIKKTLNVNIPIIHLYTYPTISELLNCLFPEEVLTVQVQDEEQTDSLSNKKRLLSRRQKLEEVTPHE